jgi:hypothetical protein
MADELDDGFSRAVRFFCGALFGGFIGLRWFLFYSFGAQMNLWFAIGGLMLLCGLAAAKFGDGFWERALGYLRWWA